jgi:hypothetical protein
MDILGQVLSPSVHIFDLRRRGVDPAAISLTRKTDPLGFEVTQNAIDNRRLFATIFKALGIDPKEQYDLPDLPTFHRVEGDVHPIQEILIG